MRTHEEVLEFRRKTGDAEKLRRVLTLMRDNLMRQERYEEALVVVQEELPLARRLAVPGRYEQAPGSTAEAVGFWP